MKKLKVGIDNYCLFPKKMMPGEILDWASVNGGEGVAFSGFEDEMRKKFTASYLSDIRKKAADLSLYLEWGNGQHVPMDLTSFSKKEIYSSNRKAISEASAIGARIIRSCSGGLMRWKHDAPDTEVFLNESAKELKKQASLFRDNRVILAIETHFEFTTFELLRLFEMCEAVPGDWLGICLDTMNLLTMLEDPLSATERILPWIVSTHIKDGGIITSDNGITTFPAAFGTGIIEFESLLRKLQSVEREIFLSIESHGGSFFLPVNEKWFIKRFPDLQVEEYNKLLDLAGQSSEKMTKDELIITDRTDWPSICEKRTINDIRNVKILRDRI